MGIFAPRAPECASRDGSAGGTLMRRIHDRLDASSRRGLRREAHSMAIYYLNIKQISRRDGSRATSAAAYRSGTAITDERSGRTFNHSGRDDIEHQEIVLPGAAAAEPGHWARDRSKLWNAAEAAEQRRTARVAREYAVALPHELNAMQRLALARQFASYIAERYHVAVDLALHQPRPLGDARNFHAHLLTTTRELTPDGLGAKSSAEITNTQRRERGLPYPWRDFKEIRAHWAQLANEQLRAIGSAARIDARSLAAQGIERRPTTHLGLAVTSMQRRGIQTEVGKRVAQERAQEQAERERRTASAALTPEPVLRPRAPAVDPSSSLQFSLHANSGRQGAFVSLEARQRAGAEQWFAMRQAVQEQGQSGGASRDVLLRSAAPAPLTPEQLPLPRRAIDGYEW